MCDNPHALPCALCGEEKPESFRIYFDGYIKLYRCLTCGFVGQYPGPGHFTVVTSYENRYSMDWQQEREFMYPHRRRNFQDVVDRISKVKSGGKLLDVGCGDGHFMSMCVKKGFDCCGVEDSKGLAEYAATKTGAKVMQGRYDAAMFAEEQFDVVTLIQVLEHIPEPRAALETIMYHLRPGGLLVIEVPSIRSPHFLAYRLTRLKWFVKPPEGVIYSHCGYYTPKTLQAMVEKCGFKTHSIVTGRWQCKYNGLARIAGKILDPFFNVTRIGGILLFAIKQ